MTRPLSNDFRQRLVAAVDGGMTRRAAAERFGVAPSTAINWTQQWRQLEHAEPRHRGGDKRSHRIKAHASEQERPDVARRRRTWFEARPDLDPERLVFIDETGASTKMARRYGRSPRGSRCRASVPHGHWKTTTFVGASGLRA